MPEGGLGLTEHAERQGTTISGLEARTAELQEEVARAQAEVGSLAQALEEARAVQGEAVAEAQQQMQELERANAALVGRGAELVRRQKERQAAMSALEMEREELLTRLQEQGRPRLFIPPGFGAPHLPHVLTAPSSPPPICKFPLLTHPHSQPGIATLWSGCGVLAQHFYVYFCLVGHGRSVMQTCHGFARVLCQGVVGGPLCE